MKQTFIQKFRSNQDGTITRQQIAQALENIAAQLRQPLFPDHDQVYYDDSSGLCFEISGWGTFLHPEGFIELVTNLSSRRPR